jgi:hypothetical protein
MRPRCSGRKPNGRFSSRSPRFARTVGRVGDGEKPVGDDERRRSHPHHRRRLLSRKLGAPPALACRPSQYSTPQSKREMLSLGSGCLPGPRGREDRWVPSTTKFGRSLSAFGVLPAIHVTRFDPARRSNAKNRSIILNSIDFEVSETLIAAFRKVNPVFWKMEASRHRGLDVSKSLRNARMSDQFTGSGCL